MQMLVYKSKMVHMVARTDSNPKGWKCMFTNICSQIANSLLSLFPSNHHPPTTSLYIQQFLIKHKHTDQFS